MTRHIVQQLRSATLIMALLPSTVAISTSLPSSTADAAAGNGCRPAIIAMPLPDGDTNGDILATTADGRIAVGYVADDAQHQDVAIWRHLSGDWSVQDLGNLGVDEPHSGLSATGVSAGGEVSIGVLTDVVGGWVYADGQLQQLQDFAGGLNAYARGINDNGETVGEALDAQGNDFAALWTSPSARPIKLRPAAGYDGSFAQGIDDRGVVVGGSFANDSRPQVATRWSPSGHPVPLLGLGGDADATAVIPSGRMVGEASDGTVRYGVVWSSGRAPHSVGLFDGDEFSRLLDVSANGYAVGFEGSNPPPPEIPVRHVVLWSGHGPARSLLPLSRRWSDGAYSHTLDDRDDVFGTSSRTHQSLPQPTEWTCAVEQSFVPPAAG